MDLNFLTIAEAHKGLKERRFSSEELTRACLQQIDRTKNLNNFITLTEGQAIETASMVDAKIAAGETLKPLSGIPGGMKDIFNTKGVRTTAASNILHNYISPYESTATAKLKEQDYVLLGKVNLDEFACGSSSERSYIGPSLNPWDLERVAGGSSGGSASAVASGQALFSLGTDTFGSIRFPAALCGVVGLKVTYGRVSRFGVAAMASSWDTVGPLTRSIEDAAIVLQAMAGHDPLDATTPKVEVPDYSKNLSKGVKGLRIGVPKEYFGEGVDAEVREIVMKAIKSYEEMGASIQEVSLPMTEYAVAMYYVGMPAELSTNLARYDGIRFGHGADSKDTSDLVEYYKQSRGEGFGDEIKRRIMIGTFVLSAGYADAYYRKSLQVRTLIIRDFEKAFQEVDVLMSPVSPVPAFKVGEVVKDPLAMYLMDALTGPINAAGVPAVSLPCGFTKSGLPVGLQVVGPFWSEDLILQVAAAYEQANEWKSMRPPKSNL